MTFTHNLPEDSPSALLLESLEGYPDAITDIVVEPVGKGRAARNRPHIYATCIDCTSSFKFEIRSLSKRKDTGLRCRKCMNKVKPRKVAKRKHTLESVRQEFINRGVTPTFTELPYDDVSLPFICACGQPGTILINNLRGKSNPPQCSECSKKYSIEKIQDVKSKGGPSILNLFKEFPAFSTNVLKITLRKDLPGNHNILSCICESCSTRFDLEARRETLESRQGVGFWCKKCLAVHKAEGDPVTLERIQTAFLNAGVQPTFTEYTGVRSNYHFLCACGQPGQINLGSFLYNSQHPRCPRCITENQTATAQETAKRINYPTGSDHPSWNPDLTDEDRAKTRHGRGNEFAVWAKNILARDNYTCQATGQRGGELSAHHVLSWSRHPELRFDPANGTTLARDVHDAYHAATPVDQVNADTLSDFITQHRTTISNHGVHGTVAAV